MGRSRGRRTVRGVVVAWCVLLVAGCGAAGEVGEGEGDSAPQADRTTSAPAAPAPTDRPTTGRTDPPGDGHLIDRRLRPLVDDAVSDLARRVEVPPEKIRVLSAQRVTPSDDALDCPRAVGALDRRHAGARVRLEIEGVVFHYRVGVDQQEPFLCDPEAAKRAELEDRIEP